MKKLFLITGLPATDNQQQVERIANRHCECMTYCNTELSYIDNCIEKIKNAQTKAVLISGYTDNIMKMQRFYDAVSKEDDIELVMVMELLQNNDASTDHPEEVEYMRNFYKEKHLYKSLTTDSNLENVCTMMEIMIRSRVGELEEA